MSAQSRRERAYRHYLAKHMRQRQKQLAKAQKAANHKLKRDLNAHQPQVSQPTVFSSAEPNDQVGAPMTISSSEATSPDVSPQP